MFNLITRRVAFGDKEILLETGKIARQADGAIVARMGDTVVLCASVVAKKVADGASFFPFTVHYQEKAYAAGKIPGGFFKREGRPSEKEILTSRLIDRVLRPLFPDHFYNEVQIICTVLSYDGVNSPDIVALIGASASIAISGIPFTTAAGVRVALINNEFSLNPSPADLLESDLDLVVGGSLDSVLMVESEAKQVSKEKMLEAVLFGHAALASVINAIDEIKAELNKPLIDVIVEDSSELFAEIEGGFGDSFVTAYLERDKQKRSKALSELRNGILVQYPDSDKNRINSLVHELEQRIVRNNVLENNQRIDGRTSTDIRQIEIELGLLPRVHGSALFTRGETQALVVTTLGSSHDEQMIDGLEGATYRERFMLHYNFPPYSVGESSPLRPAGRREIGHGRLAWRAINPVLPTAEEFPYSLRVVSEITESNGSSSMASVCGASLALMDAGVPTAQPVAGIAMGLIKESEKFVILSDIMGDEDHLGDMDFKVAGTKNGITALQMDIKIAGISGDIMERALEQAWHGIEHILGLMNQKISFAREEVNSNAPKIITMQINKEKIRDVIGSGGKVIRGICEETGVTIDIDDDGLVKIAAPTKEGGDRAIAIIEGIVTEPEIGKIYTGKVNKIVQFGAFVNFMGQCDGLVHVSELADHRVEEITEILNEGDVVKVKVLAIDPKGKVRLSYRAVNQETGEEREVVNKERAEKPREDRPREPRRDSKNNRPPRNPRRDSGQRSDDTVRQQRAAGNMSTAETDKPSETEKKKRKFFFFGQDD